MISGALINFLVVIVVQYLLFVLHALWVGEKENILRYTGLGMAAGVLFGVVFDLVVGQFFGLYSYANGFVWWFLGLKGLFSFGFIASHVFLLRRYRLVEMFAWACMVGALYEFTNYFFPVWEWTFAASAIEYAAVISVGYGGLTLLLMTSLRLAYGTQFRVLTF